MFSPEAMLCFALAASLAAAPAPRAATATETVVHIPRMDAIQGLTAFLERAGQPAALLRPDAWFAELHPIRSLDPRQPDTLTRAGIDPATPLTLSLLSSGRISCTRLADPKLFQACAFASVGGSFVDDGQGKVLFKEASRLVGLTPKANTRMAKLPGTAYVSIPKRGLTVGLDGSATALLVEGTSTQLPLPAFQSSGTSPTAA